MKRDRVLGDVYIYGHLVAATFSLAMALAFGVSGARVPGARADHWYVLTFGLTASTAMTEMGLALHPTLWMARIYLSLQGLLLFAVTLAFHMQFGRDVFDPRRAVRHRHVVEAYGVVMVAVVLVALTGVGDGGRVIALARAGVHSAAMHLMPWAFALFLAYSFACTPVMAPVLLGRGQRAAERRLIAVPLMFIPVVALHELLLTIGAVHTLPIGGYFAAFTGVVGAFVLAERFRGLQGGTVIGRYTVERRIGGGGMADVYLARRSGLSVPGVVQRVALKRLRPEYADDDGFARMFLDEARLIARLAHPHIVTLLDVGAERGGLYLAMELVEGAPLSRVARFSRGAGITPSTAALVEVGVQIADALAYAHELGDENGRPLELVHRDVSPHNILCDRDGNLKLADFGIARSAARGSRTLTGVMKGKLLYMAPEQVTGSRYDHRIDLYALGVVLCELGTGHAPYDGCDEGSVLRRLMDGDPEPYRRAEALPPPLGPLVRWAVSPDPEARPPSARALLDALRPLRDEARGRRELATLVADALAAMHAQDDAATAVDVRRSSSS